MIKSTKTKNSHTIRVWQVPYSKIGISKEKSARDQKSGNRSRWTTNISKSNQQSKPLVKPPVVFFGWSIGVLVYFLYKLLRLERAIFDFFWEVFVFESFCLKVTLISCSYFHVMALQSKNENYKNPIWQDY